LFSRSQAQKTSPLFFLRALVGERYLSAVLLRNFLRLASVKKRSVLSPPLFSTFCPNRALRRSVRIEKNGRGERTIIADSMCPFPPLFLSFFGLKRVTGVVHGVGFKWRRLALEMQVFLFPSSSFLADARLPAPLRDTQPAPGQSRSHEMEELTASRRRPFFFSFSFLPLSGADHRRCRGGRPQESEVAGLSKQKLSTPSSPFPPLFLFPGAVRNPR